MIAVRHPVASITSVVEDTPGSLDKAILVCVRLRQERTRAGKLLHKVEIIVLEYTLYG